MATPQEAIFHEGSSAHHYLEYDVAPDVGVAAVIDAVARARATSAGDSRLVVAFGAELWRRLAPDAVPDRLTPFQGLEGVPADELPVSQRDLFFWVHGPRLDDVLDRALAVDREIEGVASLRLDERGFTYHDSRDLTGFVDGSANPKGEAAREAALVPDDRAGAGGAFVLTQRWVHDLEAFLALPVPEQEGVIGRTKPDSIELEGEAMPPDSHVARTDVAVGGRAVKIYRRSAPFGRVAEKGLYFLAFAGDPGRFEILLARMYGTFEDGVRDRLIGFTKPVTGAYWFAPSEEALAALR
ncbi:MAG: Dyp-type peroxidase [Alphaproteobacteria bacterium]|jgi:putative iron-dependent peroxidase|nr:Dyp-type peroxidase [Alphaproteobacteria bacterium]